MTPEQHLAAAKEAVASQTVYKTWENIVDEVEYEDYLEHACLLALTNQAKELHQEKAQAVSKQLTSYKIILGIKEDEISQLKSDYNNIAELSDKTYREYEETIQQIKSELSKSTEEKAKAFDEGCEHQLEEIFSPDDLGWPSLHKQLRNKYPIPSNPYRDKENEVKQD